jgi:limonene-1,2-epoxide hydrolase
LGVITVRDGQIVSYRDYMNPIALADVFGQTSESVSALCADNA